MGCKNKWPWKSCCCNVLEINKIVLEQYVNIDDGCSESEFDDTMLILTWSGSKEKIMNSSRLQLRHNIARLFADLRKSLYFRDVEVDWKNVKITSYVHNTCFNGGFVRHVRKIVIFWSIYLKQFFDKLVLH